MNYIKNKNQGFTLVEVVVVVVILVILAGIVIPSFSKFISDKAFSEKIEEEVDDVMKSAQIVFYQLYAENSHGDTNDCIFSGDNQIESKYNDAKKYPTTYKIPAGNVNKDCDVHWNPLAAKILSLANLDIRDNYPSTVLICAGRYDIYANPSLDTYDPEKAYTVYLVGYQPIDGIGNKFNKQYNYYIFKSIDGKVERKKNNIVFKDYGSPIRGNEKQNYMMVNGEKIWVQFYLIKADKNNGVFLEKLWNDSINKSDW